MRDETVPQMTALSAVDQYVIDIYCHAVRHGMIECLDETARELGLDRDLVVSAINQLMDTGLIIRDTCNPSLYLPIGPDVATALLTYPMEREIYQRREFIARIKGSFGTLAQSGALNGNQVPAATAAIERIDGGAVLKGFLKESGDACEKEIIVLQPYIEDENEFDDLLQCFHVPVDRGIRLRIVLPHRCRSHLRSRAAMKRLIEAGAEVRTVSRVPQSLMVFDNELSVLGCGAADDCVVTRVRAQDVVKFLIDHFLHLWDTANPVDVAEFGYAEAADSLQQDIAKLMAQGYTDEAVARRLGMSVRTCRRHIAALMGSLDAVSRFQAGVRAASSDLIELT